MEDISLLVFAFGTIQNLLVISLVYTLLILDIKDKKFLVLLFMITFIQVVVRSFPVTSLIIIFISFTLYILYFRFFYKIPIFLSSAAVGFSIFTYITIEGIVISFLLNVTNIDPQYALSTVWVRGLFMLPIIFLMIIIIFLFKYFEFSVIKLFDIVKLKDLGLITADDMDIKRERKVTYTFYTVLLFLILQGLFINVYIWGEKVANHYQISSFFTSAYFVNFIIITFNIILILLLRYLVIVIRTERNEVLKRIKEKNILRLDWEKRAQMHDRNHHLSMLYMLLQVNKVDRAKDYLKGMVGEIQNVDAIIKTGNHALNALIRSKIALGKKYGITVNVIVNNTLGEMNIMDWDLNRIVGNLLENAIEAIESKDGSVDLMIDSRGLANSFVVITNGVVLPDHVKEQIFQKGYTNKKENGHGLGLAICKELADLYQGEINIQTDGDKKTTSFELLLPTVPN